MEPNFIPQQTQTSPGIGFIKPFLYGIGFCVLVILSFEIYAFYKEKKKATNQTLSEAEKEAVKKLTENGKN